MGDYLARRTLHSVVSLVGLLVLVFFLARLTGAMLDDSFTSYTGSGLAVELLSVLFAVLLLRRSAGAQEPAPA